MIIPDFCFALNNMTINPKNKLGEVIKIKAFETGYYKTSFNKSSQEDVDEMNKMIGVDKPTAHAMSDASVFGWQCYKNCLDAYTKLYKEKNGKINSIS